MSSQFVESDLRSLEASVEVAVKRGIRHFVFLSVTRPAPVMRACQNVRAQCESLIESAGLTATIVKPWYILGQGHRWPIVLEPLYWLAEHSPKTREGALRLGLVQHGEITRALTWAVENPPAPQLRIWDVPAIRAAARRLPLCGTAAHHGRKN